MEQTIMENDAPYLPGEIITNILLRLPVKSLIRFQCVCKDWKNLFKTSSFISEHLLRSTKQNPLLVVGCIISACNPWHLCLLNREMQVLEYQNPPIIGSLMASWWMVYSSNGLLCVEITSRSQHSFWLWNPSIRVVRQVPKSLNNYEGEYSSVGFGFSPIVNDYKIVQLFMMGYLVVQVEVYALRAGSWRKVEFGNLEGVHVNGCSSITCNGAIFWFGLKRGVEEDSKNDLDLNLIVSFDIATELFTLMPLPTSAHHSCFNSLTIHENKLAMLSLTAVGNFESSLIDLWVMEECSDASRDGWRWTKIYTTKPTPCWLRPEIIWRNEIVCRVDAISEGEVENHESKVVLCNITADEFNIFDIPEGSYSHRIFDYAESLVLLDNIHI